MVDVLSVRFGLAAKDALMGAKRKSYTPKYRQVAAHLVIDTGRTVAAVAQAASIDVHQTGSTLVRTAAGHGGVRDHRLPSAITHSLPHRGGTWCRRCLKYRPTSRGHTAQAARVGTAPTSRVLLWTWVPPGGGGGHRARGCRRSRTGRRCAGSARGAVLMQDRRGVSWCG